jgi:hypothetical protein
MRNILAAMALLAGCALAHATGSISCASRDGRTRVDVLVSLAHEGVGSGITALALTQPGTRPGAGPTTWTVTRAQADYRQHTLHVVAHAPGHEAAGSLRLDVRREQGLLQGPQQAGRGLTRRWRMGCDWGEFS